MINLLLLVQLFLKIKLYQRFLLKKLKSFSFLIMKITQKSVILQRKNSPYLCVNNSNNLKQRKIMKPKQVAPSVLIAKIEKKIGKNKDQRLLNQVIKFISQTRKDFPYPKKPILWRKLGKELVSMILLNKFLVLQ